MRFSKASLIPLAAGLVLLFSAHAHGQGAYGYASIDIDSSTNTVNGWASTELDYQTAAYYNAEVEAHIEDESGNILASGSNSAYQSASVVLSASGIIQCITYRIISYLILNAIIFDDCGYVDVFGFGFLPFDYYWDYGYFWNDRWLCRWESFIRVAELIETVTECVDATVECSPSSLLVLPSGLSQSEMNFITSPPPANATFTCAAFDSITGQPVQNILLSFTVNTNNIPDDGGHQNHAGVRPAGSFNHASVRTDGSGQAQSVYSPPAFGGTSNIVISSNGTTVAQTPIFNIVPGLQALPPPQGNAGYRLTGSSEDGNTYHNNGHYATQQANTHLQQIAATYRDTFFPANQFPNGVPFNDLLRFNDASLKFGGKFDITPNFRVPPPPSWRIAGSHDEHRVGINCDVSDGNIPNNQVVINGTPRNRWQVMEEMFCANGSTRTNREHCRNHWHLRFEFGQNGCHETEGCRRAALGESLPVDGVAAAVPGQIQIEAYDQSDEAGASFVPDDGNGSPGDIYYSYPQALTMPGNESNCYVPTIGGQWMNYTVNIAATDTYTFTTNVASPFSGNSFHVEVDGVDKTGPITIPNTGSESTFQLVSIDNISLDAGPHMITLVIDGNLQPAGNFDSLTISPYHYQSCNPSSGQLNACWRHGGDWDYDLCYCVYY
jgi:hypothetical protein